MTRPYDTPLAPTRERSLLPAELELVFGGIAIAVAGVYGGGLLSGILSGHGIVWPGARFTAVLARLWHHPGNPAAAWPSDPRPGPAWLTWGCIALAAVAFTAAMMMARTEFDLWRRNRRSSTGMATKADLRRAGLDHVSANDKAVAEFPTLAKTAALPLRSRMARRWRR
ncbi:hypothetical protein ACFXG4_30430 [Nocardia sp. NPDC059246]|uniref:hypothetical protein n=1 Tax=unclassified Nocardia TaxID=2637762 RepID=UPI0036CD60F7